jgi:putative ABC transport system ATP-binding protein
MSLISLACVSKTYKVGAVRVIAVREVSLAIDAGEFVALSGPSGSGKSTLCNLIGLLDEPDSGTVQFAGRDVSAWDDNRRSDERLRGIGFVFQSFNLVPVFTVLENVLLPIQLHGAVNVAARQRAASLIESLGLGAEMNRRPNDLSGGQQQRTAIARALITEPLVVIADEPTANLDTANARAIIDIMHQKNRQLGTTFVFSTHDDRLIRRVDREVCLRDGAIIEDTTQADRT